MRKIFNFVWRIIRRIFDFFEKRIYLSIPSLISIVALVTFVQALGLLAPLELKAFDHLIQLRKPEPIDPRVVIVGITAEDVQKLKTYPLTDTILAQLLDTIRKQKPSAIGLDLYRDIPVPSEDDPGYEKLINIFKTTPNLVGITYPGIENNPGIDPPPYIANESSNVVFLDEDSLLRKATFFPGGSKEQNIATLGFYLALFYLDNEENINHEWIKNKDDVTLKLGSVKFSKFSGNDGGYVDEYHAGYQTLLNYRSHPKKFLEFSVSDVLEGKVPEDTFKDKIVFVGNIDYSAKDVFKTPYSTELLPFFPKSSFPYKHNVRDHYVYGVYIQANITSFILGAVLDSRPLLKVLSQTQEIFAIAIFVAVSLISITFSGRLLFRTIDIDNWYTPYLFYLLSILLQAIVIFLASLLVFEAFILNSLWMPIVSIVLGILICFIFKIRDPDLFKIKQQKQELAKLKLQLERANLETQDLQKQAQEFNS